MPTSPAAVEIRRVARHRFRPRPYSPERRAARWSDQRGSQPASAGAAAAYRHALQLDGARMSRRQGRRCEVRGRGRRNRCGRAGSAAPPRAPAAPPCSFTVRRIHRCEEREIRWLSSMSGRVAALAAAYLQGCFRCEPIAAATCTVPGGLGEGVVAEQVAAEENPRVRRRPAAATGSRPPPATDRIGPCRRCARPSEHAGGPCRHPLPAHAAPRPPAREKDRQGSQRGRPPDLTDDAALEGEGASLT